MIQASELKPYKKRLPIEDLTLRLMPDNEKFERTENRLFYYLGTHKGKQAWIRTGQGNYNLMAANGYYVSYVDNAMIDEYEF